MVQYFIRARYALYQQQMYVCNFLNALHVYFDINLISHLNAITESECIIPAYFYAD